jgi:hypothetical protein
MSDKPLGTIQVDVDGLWVLRKFYGESREFDRDLVLESALPRFLDLFSEFGVRATFFVTGHDLTVPMSSALIRRLQEAGHELANHTMTHPSGFSVLSRAGKSEEIERAEETFQKILGIRPEGFRTPDYDGDAETLSILSEKGYIYDASVMTALSPCVPALNTFRRFILRDPHQAWRYLGKKLVRFPSWLAPLAPYRPETRRFWRAGAGRGGLWEVPVTTIPLLRLPFHASFVIAGASLGVGPHIFRLGHRWVTRRGLPIHFVFHAYDLSDPIPGDRLKRHVGLGLAVAKKMALARQMVSSLSATHRLLPTREMVACLEGPETPAKRTSARGLNPQ